MIKKSKLSKALAISLAAASLFSNNAFADTNRPNLNIKEYSNVSMDRKSTSNTTSFSANGKNYYNYTSVEGTYAGAYGSTVIKCTSGKVTDGIMGVHANLYNSSGNVVKTTNWQYNTRTTDFHSASTKMHNVKGTYHTQGTTKAYNGSGYKTVGAKKSPIATVKSLNIDISEQELKERQYLYETKNLISAVGFNDIKGYVSLDDLYDEENQPQNPKEAVA
ncbi:hypothetical protein F1383_18425, partial [Clostridioides difficile]|nr:hypothetical protein [Clostridioides difficile]MBH7696699.1 hypothetical protein [Clostridioides difficile]MBH7707848.1 hypothetical protein [Clostridioides difficile]MCK8744017.1 hypothetical protein [Clostridioides difficile]MDS2218962.1 hypothetical protein [Clostridioides difficile]